MTRSSNYRCNRDHYRSLRGAPPKWRSTSPAWASHIWALPKTSLRRRGTLIKTMWDQWWHGENTSVAGVQEGACPLCRATVCSQDHIQCVCLSLEEQLLSITNASYHLPQGPQRQLITTLLDMASNWAPLDEHAMLWTGKFTKLQRTILHPHIQRLPLARSRSLLTGTCRSFVRATRTIREGFRTLVSEAEHSDSLNALPHLPY